MEDSQDLKTVMHQRDVLAQAIQEAGEKSGIVEKNFELSGPQLLMVVSDMGAVLREANDRRNKLARDLSELRDKLESREPLLRSNSSDIKQLLTKIIEENLSDVEHRPHPS